MDQAPEHIDLEKISNNKKQGARRQNRREKPVRGNQRGKQQKNNRPLRRVEFQSKQKPQRQQQHRQKPLFKPTGVRQQTHSSSPQPNVILKGLGTYVTDQQLREITQGYGPMDMCKLDRDNFGNVKPQGIGLIKFERLADAEMCVKGMDNANISSNQQHPSGQLSAKLIRPKEDRQIQRRNGFHKSQNRQPRRQ